MCMRKKVTDVELEQYANMNNLKWNECLGECLENKEDRAMSFSDTEDLLDDQINEDEPPEFFVQKIWLQN